MSDNADSNSNVRIPLGNRMYEGMENFNIGSITLLEQKLTNLNNEITEINELLNSETRPTIPIIPQGGVDGQYLVVKRVDDRNVLQWESPSAVPPDTPTQTESYRTFFSTTTSVTETALQGLTNYNTLPIRIVTTNPHQYLIIAFVTDHPIRRIFVNYLTQDQTENDVQSGSIGNIYDPGNIQSSSVGTYKIYIQNMQTHIDLLPPGNKIGILID